MPNIFHLRRDEIKKKAPKSGNSGMWTNKDQIRSYLMFVYITKGALSATRPMGDTRQNGKLSFEFDTWWDVICNVEFMRILYGCFLKWWYPQNTPKWSFLVGKAMVVGYHHFLKHPCFLFGLICSGFLGRQPMWFHQWHDKRWGGSLVSMLVPQLPSTPHLCHDKSSWFSISDSAIPKPTASMSGIFTYIWLFLMVKYGKCR